MQQVETEFEDSTFRYTQLMREGNFALYRVHRIDNVVFTVYDCKYDL